MRTQRGIRLASLLVAVVLLAGVPTWAQNAIDPILVGDEANSLLIRKMNWVLNDMVRCIEELRRARDPQSRRYLVEEVEKILYDEVEFPLLYKQSDNASSLNVDPIGAVSDVADAGEVSPLATLYAEAFALAGIAKGYEGFSAAATDYITRAQEIYSDVLSLQVKIDSFQDAKALSKWMADARGRWGATLPLRVTFYGKSVSQEVVDGLGLENVMFQAEKPTIAYYLYAAKRDFLVGMRRKLATDDVLKRKRVNHFSIYLPPGHYRISTGVSADYGNDIEVYASATKNHYMIETIEDGIAIFPVTDIDSLMKDIEADQEKAEQSALGSGLDSGSSGDEDEGEFGNVLDDDFKGDFDNEFDTGGTNEDTTDSNGGYDSEDTSGYEYENDFESYEEVLDDTTTDMDTDSEPAVTGEDNSGGTDEAE